MFLTRYTLVALLSSALAFSASGVSAQSSASGSGGVNPSQLSTSSALVAGGSGSPETVAASKPAARPQVGRFSRIGFGVKVGLLGVGFEAATPIARDLNLRGGGNFFNYSRSFDIDGINYAAKFNLRSVEASLDFFPWAKAFHISPGAILYNGISLDANANVPSGSRFTLNGHTYVSSSTNPVAGTANVDLNHFAPKLTFGFGNLIPRNGRHFSIPFEIGFAYIGDPKVKLNFTGSACSPTYPVSNCQDVTTSQQIQSDIAAQEAKFQKDTSAIKLMPLFSIGIAFNRGLGRW